MSDNTDIIILKNNTEAGIVPAPSELVLGEVAINTADAILYAKKNDGSVVAVGGSPSLVQSVAGRTGQIVLTKNDVGLDNVDNTSDIDKPISSNVQSALNTKSDINHQHNDSNFNTSVGLESSLSTTSTGNRNTSIGYGALSANTSGFNNSGVGSPALWQNKTGANNTSVGAWSLIYNDSGSDNVAIGVAALGNNVNASRNTAVGGAALVNTTTGVDNIAIGCLCGVNNITGSSNTIIGANANVSSSNFNNCIILGTNAVASRSGQLVLGSSSNPLNTSLTVGSSGTGQVLPGQPLGYLQIRLNNILVKIPYYRE